MKKIFLVFAFISCQFLFSQEQVLDTVMKFTDSTHLPVIDSAYVGLKQSKWKFGCGVGMNFVGGTNLSLSPNLNYQINKKMTFGFGIQGSYAGTKNVQDVITYGGTINYNYTPIPKMIISADLVQLFVNKKTETNNVEVKDNFTDTAAFLGLGYQISKFTFGAKYNLLYVKDKSVYTSPIVPFFNVSF